MPGLMSCEACKDNTLWIGTELGSNMIAFPLGLQPSYIPGFCFSPMSNGYNINYC